VTEYEWDHRNRLVSVTEKDDQDNVLSSVEYTYDVYDRRIAKSVDADGPGGNAAVVTRYTYDGASIVLTFDGDQAADLTHRYLHGPTIDQILADEDAGNDILWPLTDNLGTVRDLVDDAGSVQNHIEYDSFGNVTAESNAAIDHLFAFTGRERDEETGLQYHRARYYDPAVGRWVSEDPIGFSGGDADLHRYVLNNPTNSIDLLGLKASDPSLSGSSILSRLAHDPNYANSIEYHRWVHYSAPSISRLNVSGTSYNNSSSTLEVLSDYFSGFAYNYRYYWSNPNEMDPSLQIVRSVANGMVVGAATAAVVVVTAPVLATAGAASLASLGMSATAAGTTSTGLVTFGLLTAGGVGAVGTTVDSVQAANVGDWNRVAFNLGTLGGGVAVGASGGGRFLANGLMTPRTSPAPNTWNLSHLVRYEWTNRYRPISPIYDPVYWATAPTPLSGGTTAGLSYGVIHVFEPFCEFLSEITYAAAEIHSSIP
jgi:RHS repeat-associated protein